VRRTEADYLAPARLEEELRVETWVDTIKGASLVMGQAIYRGDILIFRLDITLVCVKEPDFKPVRVPDDLREGFGRFTKDY